MRVGWSWAGAGLEGTELGIFAAAAALLGFWPGLGAVLAELQWKVFAMRWTPARWS